MNNSIIAKNAQVATEHLVNNEFGLFKTGFETGGKDYIRRDVTEKSIAEAKLNVVTVTRDHPKVQEDKNTDTLYYIEHIESPAIAMEVSIRGLWKPRFITGNKYTIEVGKIESEPVKKPQMELMVANDIVEMVKTNNAEAIRKIQDTGFMKAVVAGLASNGNVTGGAGTSYASAINWTTAPSKIDLTNLKSLIAEEELIPASWLMSESAWNAITAMDAGEIGDLSGEMLQNGLREKRLLDLPVLTTVKSSLTDGTNYFFDYTYGGKTYSNIYLFVDPSYLGKVVKIGTDQIWSEWRRDMFEWNSWRYVGLGFGDCRGIARARVQLRGSVAE